jgi:hypothetical protein
LRGAHRSAQKAQEDGGVQRALIDHEAQPALVRQTGDHRVREAGCRAADDRRLAVRCETAAVIGLVGQPGLIGPLDFCPFRLGARRRDGWLFMVKPTAHGGLATLCGALHRPLRGKAPGPHIRADSAPCVTGVAARIGSQPLGAQEDGRGSIRTAI